MVEAAVRRSWETEGEGIVPQVSPLLQAFLTATGRTVSPSSVRECWPSENDIIPRQHMNEVRACITHCLDKAAMWSPSTIAWDMFAWPESNKNFWKEDCLPYSPRSTVDLSVRLPEVRLRLHDREGKYHGVARVLKYEGHMLIYDPQTNGTGWVAMRGVPSSLMGVEVKSAEDLGNFYPVPRATQEDPQATRPPPQETEDRKTSKPGPPRLATEYVEANVDWDTDDVQDRSRPPSPTSGISRITLGESAEDTPPARRKICLVSERVIETEAEPPQEKPEVEEKTQGDGDDAPPKEQEPNLRVKVISLICMGVQKNCRAFYDVVEIDYMIIPCRSEYKESRLNNTLVSYYFYKRCL